MITKKFTHIQWMRPILGIFTVLALLGAMLVVNTPAARATDVCGPIFSDTTWTLAGSPYVATCAVLVQEGMTLTIEPGVEVRFNASTALQIDGELIAQGTSGSLITFTSNIGTSPGDWGYILFSNSSADATYDAGENYVSGSIMEYAVVEYAGGAGVSNNGAVRMDNAHPFINHCTIRHNQASGIYAWNLSGTLRIANSTINNNTVSGSQTASGSGGGIYASGGTTIISNNTISSNTASKGGGGIYVKGTVSISSNTINDNSASPDYYGGGGISVEGNATISDNVIDNNATVSRYGGGGGIFVSGTDSTATISTNIIINNTMSCSATYWCGGGGGIFVNGNVSIHNNILSNNTVSDYSSGGAIFLPHRHFVNSVWYGGKRVLHKNSGSQ